MVLVFYLYLAPQSKIRLFTASELDCRFWPVIRCLSMTTCTASSWLAGKKANGKKHESLGRVTGAGVTYEASHLCTSHRYLSQSPLRPAAGWQNQAAAPVQTLRAAKKKKTTTHRTVDVMRHNEMWVFSKRVTDPCEAVATEDPLLSLGDAAQGWYSLSYSTNGLCRDEHKSALHMWTPHTDCLQSLGPLTLVRDEVCENAMHGATVCQVVQSPRAVRYEQGLVPGPWNRSAQRHWAGKHQNVHKVFHFGFPTVYRFQFSWRSVGFHVEVLHPSAGAFILSRKIYRLPLQGKILNVGPRWKMSEK